MAKQQQGHIWSTACSSGLPHLKKDIQHSGTGKDSKESDKSYYLAGSSPLQRLGFFSFKKRHQGG